MTPVEVRRGDGPVVLGMPHTGTDLPPGIAAHLNVRGRELADTDWHINRLYDGLLADATIVRATFHRYVIDANRAPDQQSLYPGQNTTGLVPLTDFDGEDIWRPGEAPDETGIADRLARFHTPYHQALGAEMERVRAIHGIAILYDCHSIRSRIPFLFEGRLPDLNIGTNGGLTCGPAVEKAVFAPCRDDPDRSAVLNGRFKGGWTTRHYGRPAEGWHAVQMEIAQSAYLTEEVPPWTFDEVKADRLRTLLANILSTLETLAPQLGGRP